MSKATKEKTEKLMEVVEAQPAATLKIQELRNRYLMLKFATGLRGKANTARFHNLKKLKDIFESTDFEEMYPPSDVYREFREQLQKRLSEEKDKLLRAKDYNNPLLSRDVNGEIRIGEDSWLARDLKKELADGNEKFSKAIDVYEKDIKKWREEIRKPYDQPFKPFYIPVSELPETPELVDAVDWFVLEMTEEQEQKWQDLFSEILDV